MKLGKRDLSKVALPACITREHVAAPVTQRAIANYLEALSTIIANEDWFLLSTMSFKDATKYVQIELFMCINQIVSDTIENNTDNHVAGLECPVCTQLGKLELCHEVIVAYWKTAGLYHEYADAVRFREKAVDQGRILN